MSFISERACGEIIQRHGSTDNRKLLRAINRLRALIENRTATVGVCGMGYVGLPLAAAAAKAGFTLIAFDIDKTKTETLSSGASYIDAVSGADLKAMVEARRLRATDDFSDLAQCDVIAVCIPTPLSEPDLSFVEMTVKTIATNLRAGQLIIIEFRQPIQERRRR